MWDSSISDSDLHHVLDALEEEKENTTNSITNTTDNDSPPPPKRSKYQDPSPYYTDEVHDEWYYEERSNNWNFSEDSLSTAAIVPKVKVDLTKTKKQFVFTWKDFWSLFCAQPRDDYERYMWTVLTDRMNNEAPITGEYWQRIEAEQEYLMEYVVEYFYKH
jgi:hypothetical protein